MLISGAVIGGLLAITELGGADASWLILLASALLVVSPAVELVAQRSARRPSKGSSRGAVGFADALASHSDHSHRRSCPFGCTSPPPRFGMGLPTLAQREPPAGVEPTEVASRLAKRACEMSKGDAAWVFWVDGDSQMALVAAHVAATGSDLRGEELARARRLAEGAASAISPEQPADTRTPQVAVEDDWMVAILQHGLGRAALVVHGTSPEGIAEFAQGDPLLSLVREAAISMENSLLHESLRDILSALRQLGVHRTDYVATVSHELRTPLTSIKGFAQLLTRGPGFTDPMALDYATTIVSEADRLARIVDDIIELTQMETGLLEMRREPVCVVALIDRIGTALRGPISSPALVVRLSERIPAVRGDPSRLEQVLRWLTMDALRRATAGSSVLLTAEPAAEGVRIGLEYDSTEATIGELIQALDGPAFDDDVQATRLGRGKLGLYVSKNFVEAHGGTMWIERPGDRAVRLLFTLPC